MTGETKPSGIDSAELLKAAETLRESEKKMDAARVALHEAERAYNEAHETLMIEARGLPREQFARNLGPVDRYANVPAGQILGARSLS